MMNLWAFLLLGFLAHMSNGCVQISYFTVEKVTTYVVNTTLIQVKGSSVPVTVTDYGWGKGVKIINAIIKDVTVSSISAKCNSEGKVSVNVKGLVTVSSDSLSDAVFDYELKGEKEPHVINGYFLWKFVPGSFSQTINLTNSLTCNDCGLFTKKEVEKSFAKQCQVFIKGLFAGAITSILTILNKQYATLTEKFKLHDYDCHYALDRLEMFKESFVSYIIISCDIIGPLNDNSPLVLNTVKPGNVAIYIEEKIFNSLLASVPVNYKKAIKNTDTNGAFPSASGDLWLTIATLLLPNASITIEGAKAKFSFSGSIQDSSGNVLINLNLDVWSITYAKISGGIVKPSLGEANISQLSANDPAKADLVKVIEPLISEHASLVVKEISCGLGEFNAPDPMGIKLNNAECSAQNEQFYCVQEESES